MATKPPPVRTLCAALLTGFLAVNSVAQNIIRNSGFESPQFVAGRNDGAALDDWSFITGTGSTIRNGHSASWLPAQVGTQQYHLEISSFEGSIQQIALSLTSGQNYRFSFYLSGLQQPPGSGSARITATFTDGSNTLANTFNVTGDGWFEQSWGFVPANTADYSLTLTSPAGFASNIDDLTLLAVPEPSTYAAVAGLAALGMTLYRRRRRRPA